MITFRMLRFVLLCNTNVKSHFEGRPEHHAVPLINIDKTAVPMYVYRMGMTGLEEKWTALTGVSGMSRFSLKRVALATANIVARAKASVANLFAPSFAPALA